MKKTLLPLLLLILLPGCLNKQKKRHPKKESTNTVKSFFKSNKKMIKEKDIDFVIEDDINETDPFLIKNDNNLESVDEIDWDKSSDYSLEQKGETINFDYDRFIIKPSEDKKVLKNISEIKQKLGKNPDLTVLVEGHSCLICKNQEYNHMISQQRADKVAKEYIKRGIPSENIKTVGRGTTDCLSSVITEDQQSQNRRVETTILDL